MKRRETLVTASQNGEPVELLAVRELNTQHVLIVVRGARYKAQIAGQDHLVCEQHYRIRQEAPTHEVTISHALRLATGRIVTVADFAATNSGVRAWPIFSRLLPSAHREKAPPGRRNSPTTVNLGEFDPRRQSLCYSVIAHRQQRVNFSPGESPVAVARLAFSNFDISVVACVLDEPASTGGLLHHRADSLPHRQTGDEMTESDLITMIGKAADLLKVARAPNVEFKSVL